MPGARSHASWSAASSLGSRGSTGGRQATAVVGPRGALAASSRWVGASCAGSGVRASWSDRRGGLAERRPPTPRRQGGQVSVSERSGSAGSVTPASTMISTPTSTDGGTGSAGGRGSGGHLHRRCGSRREGRWSRHRWYHDRQWWYWRRIRFRLRGAAYFGRCTGRGVARPVPRPVPRPAERRLTLHLSRERGRLATEREHPAPGPRPASRVPARPRVPGCRRRCCSA